MPIDRDRDFRDTATSLTVAFFILFSAQNSDETVWDFEFGIGIFRPKYRGIGIGFCIEIGMKSV